MIDGEIRNRRELVDLVNEIGFLPFFTCRIEGFSPAADSSFIIDQEVLRFTNSL